MKRTRAAVALLASAPLCGCFSPPQYQFPPGGTPQQFAADQAFCNAQANVATLGQTGWFAVAVFANNKKLCMEGKGYIQTN